MNEQKNKFEASLHYVLNGYNKLVDKRYADKLNRDELMLYDMHDMFLALQSISNEIIFNDYIHPNYIVEKLTVMKHYIDTTLAYFEAKFEEANDESI